MISYKIFGSQIYDLFYIFYKIYLNDLTCGLMSFDAADCKFANIQSVVVSNVRPA